LDPLRKKLSKKLEGSKQKLGGQDPPPTPSGCALDYVGSIGLESFGSCSARNLHQRLVAINISVCES
jgi:hypothetical protein